METAETLRRRAALATVTHIAGSAYRRPGAKFLIEETGDREGAFVADCEQRIVSSILGRVPTRLYPYLSRLHKGWTIELESFHSHASNGRFALDPRAGIDPREVFLPGLVPGIEESHEQAGLRILTGNSGSLVFIAERAGEPEIVFNGETTQRPGKEVLHFHGRAHDGFLGQAITTTMLR
jgi:hypothetical protein